MIPDALPVITRLLNTDTATLAKYCGTPDPYVIVPMVLADALTWASYMVIGGWFVLFIVRARIMGWSSARMGAAIAHLFDVPLVTFVGLFVVSCGVGHILDTLAMAGHFTQRGMAGAHSVTALISVVSAAYLVWRSRHAE